MRLNESVTGLIGYKTGLSGYKKGLTGYKIRCRLHNRIATSNILYEMKSMTRALYQLFNCYEGKYLNPHDVEFVLLPDHTVTIGCLWPGFMCDEDMDLELVYEGKIIDFVKDFKSTSKAQLDEISPATLQTLYYKGIVEVYCAIDVRAVFYPLYFKRHNKRLLVRNDADEIHEGTGLTETPQNFIEYTQSHFYLVTAGN